MKSTLKTALEGTPKRVIRTIPKPNNSSDSNDKGTLYAEGRGT